MSVMIKGVEMPENCFGCPCVDLEWRVCNVNQTYEDIAHNTKERPDWCPLIEAEPIKHGRWIFSPDNAEGLCSRCNYKIYGKPYQNTYMIVPYNYCPNCGARMDGGEK